MNHHDDIPRNSDEAPLQEHPMPDSGMSWGLPLGLIAAAIVISVVFFNTTTDHHPKTVSNTPVAQQSESGAPATTR